MSTTLAWVALAATAFLVLVLAKEARARRGVQGGSTRRFDVYFFVSLVLVALGVVGVMGQEEVGRTIGWFLMAWAGSSLLLDFDESDSPALVGVASGFAAVLLSVLGSEAVAASSHVTAALAGFGVSAAAMAVRGRGRCAQDLAVVAGVGFIATYMGAKQPGAPTAETGQLFLTSATLAAVVGTVMTAILAKSSKTWPKIGTAVIFGLIGSLFCTRVLNEPDANVLIGIAVLVAVVSCYMTPDDKPVQPWAALVSALTWVAVATLAFSFLHGYGMAVASLIAVCSALLSGNRRALMFCGPLLGLTIYRFARTLYPELTSSLDLGQHYALIGFLSGLLFIPTALDAFRMMETGSKAKAWCGGAVIAAMLACTVIGLSLFLGVKGASGLLVGIGFSPLIAVILPRERLGSTAYAIGLTGFVLAMMPLALTAEGLERAVKQQVLLGMSLSLILGTVVLTILARLKVAEKPA